MNFQAIAQFPLTRCGLGHLKAILKDCEQFPEDPEARALAERVKAELATRETGGV